MNNFIRSSYIADIPNDALLLSLTALIRLSESH